MGRQDRERQKTRGKYLKVIFAILNFTKQSYSVSDVEEQIGVAFIKFQRNANSI